MKDSLRNLNHNLRIHCRDDLKRARALVLSDAEAFPEVLFAIERTGAALTGRHNNLDSYRCAFGTLVNQSPLTAETAAARRFDQLYKFVQNGRNEALHQGAYARHLAARTIELALIVEDALVNGSDRIGDYIVRGPVVAYPWQLLSVIRHEMLASSFSFLPVWMEGLGWRVVADVAVAKVLRTARTQEERRRRLSVTLRNAIDSLHMELGEPTIARPDESVAALFAKDLKGLPVLVVDDKREDHLVGIATAFDLL